MRGLSTLARLCSSRRCAQIQSRVRLSTVDREYMSSPLCTTVTGEAVARPFRDSISAQLATTTRTPPKLVGLLANSNPASRSYANWTAKACEAVGIRPSLPHRRSTLAPSSSHPAELTAPCLCVDAEYELREIGSPKAGADSSSFEMADQSEVEQAILDANNDPDVTGIMVYFPVFGPRMDGYLQQAVSPLKDVEGLHFTW